MKNGFEPLLILRQAGPKVTERTAKVYRDGLSMRLSVDLLRKALAPKRVFPSQWKFLPFFNRQEMILRLQVHSRDSEATSLHTMSGWFGNKNCRKSLIVNIRPVMEIMGLSVTETPGTYEATAGRGFIEIHFRRRINDKESREDRSTGT